MSILKKIAEFIRVKFGSFVARNVTVEDQYTKAANLLIDKITMLRTSHVKSINEEKRIRRLAEEKTALAESKEKEIRRLLANNQPVGTHAKLGLLYRRTSEALIKKADEYVAMRTEIEDKVVALDDARQDLAVKLEFIRETRSAAALGIATAEDVTEIASLTKVAVDDTLMKVDTFHSAEPGTVTTEADVEEYLASLK
ncbi:hypothetical protein AVV36_gp150 [Pectobacterium bacteriophage PM2]|uniref:Uncharacterized protein n=1 Tax=Pectobacterium bacteriophage PM2 TaxID=1429794 RepID=A0A0A0Q3I1_9CAUD|nr:hypothetical protein AVV36_gp150 [Pectobacterium bacteriophage PM2]AHY25112.1 hypothetical protein PM2_150 [Pectobacterium bacteriophage PM2]